jgi:hypothetical protein
VPSDSTRRGAAPIIQHDKETPFRIGFYGDFTQRPMIRVELNCRIIPRFCLPLIRFLKLPFGSGHEDLLKLDRNLNLLRSQTWSAPPFFQKYREEFGKQAVPSTTKA